MTKSHGPSLTPSAASSRPQMFAELTRRRLLRGGVGALSIPLLGACGDKQDPDSTGSTGELSGKVRIAWWGGDVQAKDTQAIIAVFEEDNPATTVTSQFTDWSSYWQKMSTSVAGGTLPDIVQMDVQYVGQYAKNSQLMPLDDQPSLRLNELDESMLPLGTVDGKLYAVGAGADMLLIQYNKSALQEVEASVPSMDITWDDYASYLVDLQKRLPSNVWATTATYSGPVFDTFVRQQNEEQWAADGKIAFSKDHVLEWFNYWDSLQQAGVLVPAGKTLNTSGAADSPFALGSCFVTSQWLSVVPWYASLFEGKASLGVARLPGGGKKADDGISPAVQWTISANSENQELALALVSFLLHDPEAIKLGKLNRGVPPSATARKVLEPTLSPIDKLLVQFYSEMVPKSKSFTNPPPSYYGQFSDELKRAGDAVLLGKESPVSAVDKFWDAAQELSQA